jgi:hypothetical protein
MDERQRNGGSRGKHTPPIDVYEKIEELEQRIRKLETFVLILKHSTSGFEQEYFYGDP